MSKEGSLNREVSIPWSQVLDAWPEPALIVDEGDIVRHANALAEALMGRPEAPLVGRSVDQLVPATARRRHQAHRAEFRERPAQRQMGHGADLYALGGDGAPFPAAIGLHPLSGPDTGRVLVTITDLTDRRRAEARARAIARQGDQLHHTLVAELGHDLKNLLGVILANGDHLRHRPDGEALDDLCEAAHRAVVLTDRLMAFGHDQVIDPVTILDLPSLVDGLQPLLRALVPRTIRLELQLCAVPAVRAARRTLEQVLINLVANAADAIDGCGTITVTVRAQEATVQLLVADDGQGMDPATAARVFTPRFTTKPHGHGLGLAHARAALTPFDASLRFTTAPDRGSTFVVTLPSDAPAGDRGSR